MLKKLCESESSSALMGCKLGEATSGEELGGSKEAVRKDRLECLDDESEEESETRGWYISSLEEGCLGLDLDAVILVALCASGANGLSAEVATGAEAGKRAVKGGRSLGALISSSAGLVGLKAAAGLVGLSGTSTLREGSGAIQPST